MLITQDRGLAVEALKIGRDNKAVKGVKKIIVEQIDANGFLHQFFDGKDKPQNSSAEIPLNERFAFAREVTNIAGNLPVTRIPAAGDYVMAVRGNARQQIHLLDEIVSGGEGSVFKTDRAGIVAKIYKREKNHALKIRKIKIDADERY